MTAAIGGDLAALFVLVSLFCMAATIAAALWWWPLAVTALVLGIADGHFGADLGIETGFFRLSGLDLLAVVATGAAALRILGAGRLDRLQVLWLVVSGILALSFLYGSTVYGAAMAGGSYRRFFYLTSGTLYAMTFPWDATRADRFAGLWIAAGAILAATCITLWMFPELVDIGPHNAQSLAYVSRRVLPSAGALLLSQVALIGLVAWSRGMASPVLVLLAVLCLLLTVLLFHRSVWVATLVGLGALVLMNRRMLVPIAGAVLTAGLVALAIAGIAGGFGQDLLASPLTAAVDEALSEESTFTWRVESWKILVGRTIAGGPFSILLGGGFGVGYDRMIGWSQITFSPHNVYVEIFLNAGLLGAGLWVLFHAVVVQRLWFGRADDGALLDRRTAAILLVSLMTYGVSYTPSTEQGILLGVLAGIAVQAARPSRPPRPAMPESGR